MTALVVAIIIVIYVAGYTLGYWVICYLDLQNYDWWRRDGDGINYEQNVMLALLWFLILPVILLKLVVRRQFFPPARAFDWWMKKRGLDK